MANKLWAFTMKVAAPAGEAFPGGGSGALVPTFVGAPDHEAAVRMGVRVIAARQLAFRDLQGPVREIPLAEWTAYVTKVWPDHADALPTQPELPDLVETGTVVFGPFLTYDA